MIRIMSLEVKIQLIAQYLLWTSYVTYLMIVSRYPFCSSLPRHFSLFCSYFARLSLVPSPNSLSLFRCDWLINIRETSLNDPFSHPVLQMNCTCSESSLSDESSGGVRLFICKDSQQTPGLYLFYQLDV